MQFHCIDRDRLSGSSMVVAKEFPQDAVNELL
jgi:hypothetical protein